MSEHVKAYYNEQAEREWERLNHPYRAIEMASTWRLIERYFPAKGSVCDIGSGPGRYALELLRRGYMKRIVLHMRTCCLQPPRPAKLRSIGMRRNICTW